MPGQIECAKIYHACLEKANKDLESCIRGCSGFQKAKKFADYNACVDNCESIANIDMGICATQYAICGLKGLLSWPTDVDPPVVIEN
jgi:hypothetical protein